MAFHCRMCGRNIGRVGDEPVFGDGVCDNCILKQHGLCEKCKEDGRAVKVENCEYHKEEVQV